MGKTTNNTRLGKLKIVVARKVSSSEAVRGKQLLEWKFVLSN